jgi:hypothetical protein
MHNNATNNRNFYPSKLEISPKWLNQSYTFTVTRGSTSITHNTTVTSNIKKILNQRSFK